MKLQIRNIINQRVFQNYQNTNIDIQNVMKREMCLKLADKIMNLVAMKEVKHTDFPIDGIEYAMEFLVIPDFDKFMQSIRDLKIQFENDHNELGLFALKQIYDELIK